MFKRIRWVSTGVAVGFGGSLWLQRKMKDAAGRYRPAEVAVSAAARARDALEEGRVAMKEREAELLGRAGAGASAAAGAMIRDLGVVPPAGSRRAPKRGGRSSRRGGSARRARRS